MSSSSDYSDSDDNRKGKVSDNDSDNSSKNKKRPLRTTNSKAIIESAGSSDSDGSKSDSEGCSDSENDKATSSRKRKAVSAAKKAVTKRKRAVSDDSDRGDMDDELFVDEEDRKRVMNMNEKDREQEIFNRMEQLEMRRTREQIEQKLAAAKNAAVEGEKREKRKEKRKKDEKKRKIDESDSEDDKGVFYFINLYEISPSPAKAESDDSEIDAEFHRPSELDKKRKQKNAMADLLQKRKDKEKKEAKKAALSIDAVFGKEESDSSSSSSSSSSSTASSRSSSRDSSPARRQDSDDEKKVAKKDVEFLQELSRARLSRYKLSRIVHAPFFSQSVVGCFVRIGIGMVAGKSRYRISQITEVVETAKVYNLEKTRTNKGIKLKYGKGERVYRLEFVSNTEFPNDEFEEWLRVSKEEGTVPNMDLIEKKEADIKKAMEYNYTHSDIDSVRFSRLQLSL
uniref:Plus3 domain-containing protein n=1 Tax=Heterorhabditis bacteriophora TaxID=37862 RepID=A0A1I7XL78_HETBA